MGLAEGASHSGLEPISSGTGQHFVDPQHVEGVDPHPDVEAILATVLDQVFVAANTSGLQSLGGELLQLVRHQMDGQRELVNSSLLTSQVEDPDLGVGDTTVESALGIGLVLAVAIALGRSPSHLLKETKPENDLCRLKCLMRAASRLQSRVITPIIQFKRSPLR